MHVIDIEDIEIDVLLEALFRRYGYDFRHYSRASMKRRIKHYMEKKRITRISALIPTLLYSEDSFRELFMTISVTTTEMFRDPWFFATLRDKVLPFLTTYPYINIWQAGCSTGEEVYSLAILLKEAGFYDRVRIYATDFNDVALQRAKARIYPLRDIKLYTENYQKAGGKASLSDYYHAQYNSAIFRADLQKNVTFASHNLAIDGVFAEMHLILCRNVLIYFNDTLQNRVFRLFQDSLRHGGFLCLGSKETLQFSTVKDNFDVFDAEARVYRHKRRT